MRFERKAVLAALRRQVEQGRAILAAAAGNGLVARVEDRGDTDLIIVYNSGRYRMDGIASIAGNLPIGDANAIVRDMGRRKILHMVQDTPVVAGIYGVDPTRDMRAFLEELKEIGYSGVINFPTVGKLSGRIRQELEQVGMGFAKEVERLRMAAELGFFTMAYCYCPQEARLLADAGVDIIVSHWGLPPAGMWESPRQARWNRRSRIPPPSCRRPWSAGRTSCRCAMEGPLSRPRMCSRWCAVPRLWGS